MKQLLTIGIIALAASVTAQDMPLSQVLIPSEKWQLVAEGQIGRASGRERV